MNKDARKELLDFLKNVEYLTQKYVTNVPADDKRFQALRRLVEKFYGEWQPRAKEILLGQYFIGDVSLPAHLIRHVRDFDPMASDEGGKGGRR